MIDRKIKISNQVVKINNWSDRGRNYHISQIWNLQLTEDVQKLRIWYRAWCQFIMKETKQ